MSIYIEVDKFFETNARRRSHKKEQSWQKVGIRLEMVDTFLIGISEKCSWNNFLNDNKQH